MVLARDRLTGGLLASTIVHTAKSYPPSVWSGVSS